MAHITLKVDGMTCGHCVANVERALGGVRGTKNINVDLDAGTATMEAKAPRPKLMAAVVAAGFSVS